MNKMRTLIENMHW